MGVALMPRRSCKLYFLYLCLIWEALCVPSSSMWVWDLGGGRCTSTSASRCSRSSVACRLASAARSADSAYTQKTKRTEMRLERRHGRGQRLEG
jgi:hypothetical protein